ncbi:MAG: response regulator transcription factor [Thermoanaerobaculia bacterium]
MKRTILLYSLTIALAALFLQWLEYQRAVRTFTPEFYSVALATAFLALGIWVGRRLTARHPRAGFEKNTQALDYLGITEREVEVLELLAQGHSNKEIADSLFVSPNTVKTHLAHLYDKLEVARRTQAIQKAKALRLIP